MKNVIKKVLEIGSFEPEKPTYRIRYEFDYLDSNPITRELTGPFHGPSGDWELSVPHEELLPRPNNTGRSKYVVFPSIDYLCVRGYGWWGGANRGMWVNYRGCLYIGKYLVLSTDIKDSTRVGSRTKRYCTVFTKQRDGKIVKVSQDDEDFVKCVESRYLIKIMTGEL